MKKIIAMGAAVALAASMFAAEPAANVSVAEFNGNATVKWGVNLDTKKTGFENTTWGSLKFNLFDQGDKSTSGEGIWGELKIKVDPDYNKALAWDNGNFVGGAAIVDVAKINFGDKVYVGIKSGDTTVGTFKVLQAINSDAALLSDVGANATQGIVAGYSDNNFGFDVDFRSTDLYTDEYKMAAEATLKGSNEFLADLEAKAGVTYEFKDNAKIAYAGSVAYKLPISGDFYVKPMAGYTGSNKNESKVAASLILGWGNQGWGNPGVYFLDSDGNITPGLSVSYVKDLKTASDLGTVYASFYLGSLVENLKAAADLNVELTKDADAKMEARAGVAYDVKVDSLTITPKAGMSWKNKAVGKSTLVKAGVDLNGLVPNTTFGVEYVSGNLLADPDPVKGTVNLSCQIHF